MANTAQSGNSFSPFHRFPVIIGNIRIPLFFTFTQNPNELNFKMEKLYNTTQTIGGYVFEHWGKKPTVMTGKVLIKKDSQVSQVLGLNTDTTNFEVEDAVFNPELSALMTLFNIDQRKILNLTGPLGTANKVVSKGAVYSVVGAAALGNPVLAATSAISGAAQLIGSKNTNLKKVKYKEPEPASISGYLSTLTDTIIIYKGVIYSGFFTDMSYAEDGLHPFYNRVTFSFLVTNTSTDWLDTALTQTAIGRGIAAIWGAATTAVTLGSMLEDTFKKTGSDTNGHI